MHGTDSLPPSGFSVSPLPDLGKESWTEIDLGELQIEEVFGRLKSAEVAKSVFQTGGAKKTASSGLAAWRRVGLLGSFLGKSIREHVHFLVEAIQQFVQRFFFDGKKQPVDLKFEIYEGRIVTQTQHLEEILKELKLDEYEEPRTVLAEYLLKNCDPVLLQELQKRESLLGLIAADLFFNLEVPHADERPIGLYNLGNSCYRNSVNQMLLHSNWALILETSVIEREKLLQPLEKVDRREAGALLQKIERQIKISLAFRRLAGVYVHLLRCGDQHQGELRAQMRLCDAALVQALIESGEGDAYMPDLKQYSVTGQQDAGAYLLAILRVFDKGFQAIDTRWVNSTNEQLISQGEEWMLQLPIISTKPTLQNMIDDYFATKTMHSMWRGYDHFQQQARIAEDISRSGPQETLMIQIKRNVQGTDAAAQGYNQALIDFSTDYLDLSLAYGKPKNSVLYEITGFTGYIAFGVVNYTPKKQARFNEFLEYDAADVFQGTDQPGESGHYFSFIKKGDGWYKCDDRSVSKASQADLNAAREQICLVLCQVRFGR
jgi:hypothetical protein